MNFEDQSPYSIENGGPKTRKSFVVFTDILSFTNETKEAYDDKRAEELLIKLHSALDK
jgi:hypothetical protein